MQYPEKKYDPYSAPLACQSTQSMVWWNKEFLPEKIRIVITSPPNQTIQYFWIEFVENLQFSGFVHTGWGHL